MRRAVFLDRDGVLVVPTFRDGRSFAPTSLNEFRLYPEAAACLEKLKDAGFLLIVITNQPDVGAGKVAREVIDKMHEQMTHALPLDAIKVCFHTRAQQCDCRKPLPKLILEAATELGIDREKSFMVGDRDSDVEAGYAAGCRTAFIDLGYTAELQPARVDLRAKNLSEVTDWILSAG